MTKIRPTKDQLNESYNRLKSLRKVALEFGYTPAGIKARMYDFGLQTKTASKDLYTCNDNFFSEYNEKSFYIAGFIAADGCVKSRKNKNEPSVISIALGAKDEAHLENIRTLMEVGHPLGKKIVKNSTRNPKWKDSEERELVFTSRKMCQDLSKFNVVRKKSLIYSFPEWLINHPSVNHFMRGYFDGDGSFYIQDKNNKVPQICFNLRGTLPFLYNYRSILERECSLNKRIKDVRTNSGIGALEYGGNGIVGKIAKFLYKDANIYLDRKYQIVKDLL